MSASGSEISTYTWHIENFSMCPQKLFSRIESPTFEVDFLENTKWTIRLYPRGCTDADSVTYVSCFLHRSDSFEKEFMIGYMLEAVSVDAEKSIKLDIEIRRFQSLDSWGNEHFAVREAILDSKNGFLPKDILTIKCHMWKIREESKSNIQIDASERQLMPGSLHTTDLNFENFSKVNKFFVRTRINIETKTVLWPVRRFSEFRLDRKLHKSVSSAKRGAPLFFMVFYLQESPTGSCIRIDIRRNCSQDAAGVFVRLKIKTLGAPEEIRYQEEDQHYFGDETISQTWSFPIFIMRKEIMEKNYLYYTNDVLYLHFEFAFSVEWEEDSSSSGHRRRPVTSSEIGHFNCPRNSFRHLYKSQKLADLTIRVGDRAFKVHKCILASKSLVFSAMLETNMLEKESGVIHIIDFDADIIDKMLVFIYTDTVENLSQKDAAQLYCAAEKYDIVALKCRCRCILMSNLSVDSVCDVLRLSDLFHDKDLLEAARCFIHLNTKDTFYSPEWMDFKQNYFQLATDIMFRVIREKCLT